jgi:hypothetical protein
MDTATTTGIAPELDFKTVIDNRVTEEYIRHGYSKQAMDGTTVRDDDKMRQRAFDAVRAAEVTSKANRSANAITNGELYAAVFPDGPGAQPGTQDDLDPIEVEVRSLLVRKVWGLTNPGPNGYIQKRLADTPLILCRGEVFRQMDHLPGVYVTEFAPLIMEDSLAPQIDKLVRTANDLRVHATMITGRHPELGQKVRNALGTGFSRVKTAGQLTTSEQNGSESQ